MAVNIHNLIAAINPDVFCHPEVKSEVKKIVKDKGYIAASEKAKIRDYEYLDLIDIQYKNAASTPGLKVPIERHTLIYDSFGESLEPIYFWILDKMNDEYKKVDKIVDNFISSVGSAQFSELGQKQTRMQEEAMKMLGSANTVLKSILNIIYDLKEFKMRLSIYDKNKSADKAEKEAAILSLKQIWMDTVDIKRGQSSIKALALTQQGGFVTLIDAFMAAENEALEYRGEEIDLNERVKRVLKQRVSEFYIWVKESERELRKRYEIEKIYLKSQVNSVKLYARWIKPYLKAAKQLEQNASPTAALVNAFNTSLFEIVLLGETDYKPDDDIGRGDLPKMFKNVKARKYSPIMIVEVKFRSAPERTQQGGYGFRGRTDVVFTSYALNNEELKVLRKELEDDDLNDAVKLIEGITTESLEQLKLDIDEFLEDKEEEKKEESSLEGNPFTALFSFFKDEKKEEKEEEKDISGDSYVEEIIRSQALIEARKKCYRVYDLYKKTHKMPSLPGYS
ncbi:hypothetical protein HYZ97_05020 [Candidatus Pacearchaeota archaeon]|nr:hypothetical protein [Candidatus Pacearchaeota archaeon]